MPQVHQNFVMLLFSISEQSIFFFVPRYLKIKTECEATMMPLLELLLK